MRYGADIQSNFQWDSNCFRKSKKDNPAERNSYEQPGG